MLDPKQLANVESEGQNTKAVKLVVNSLKYL